ncbi:GNAT family N-acetyltransferase [Falsiroseomonas oryziterrae]|uniref:GNAT family N-acetyltransferase n=1 Tax=Falsiroseomonas oryziterrae TaxID=2911368 RepID=UPI001F378623|nr:GNAT family N-acetyltransferase [Roseomonas sp. NPKOSM-4]
MSQPRAVVEKLAVEIATMLSEHDLEDLCEATNAAIIEGGGFGWVQQQDRAVLARHFRGALLVPDRTMFLARLDGVVVGSAQLVRPPRNNEAQAFAAQLTNAYIAPYARGFGLARKLVERVEEHAAAMGFRVLNLDVRETQETAIRLFEGLGYVRWGTHPAYARVDGRTVAGHFYYKLLEPGRGRSTESLISGT